MKSLTNIIASRFISRTDVYAVQRDDGSYNPVKRPIDRSVIEEHLSGNATYGHYLLGTDNTAKFFCFDIDLTTSGEFFIEPDFTLMPQDPVLADAWYEQNRRGPLPCNPRIVWTQRDPQSRPYFKERLRTVGELFTSQINRLGIGTCMTYSGHKGIHVYGFTGPADAKVVRNIGKRILKDTGIFVPGRGENFFVDSTGQYPGIELELFPKQDSVEPGHYGNLMRMEFGVNKKSPNDPCFLVNQRLAHAQLAPHNDPVAVLRSGNPWQDH